jgi:hypothetical protein
VPIRPTRAFPIFLAVALAGAAGAPHPARAQTCLADAAGDPNLTCSAQDLRDSFVEITTITDYCDAEGDTFTFDGILRLKTSPSIDEDVYDVGAYISKGGEQALTGQCYFFLAPPEANDVDGDACGDYTAGEILDIPLTDVTATCGSDILGGLFELQICLSFADAEHACDGPEDAVPEDGEHCSCFTFAVEGVPITCEVDADCPRCTPKDIFCRYDRRTCQDPVCLEGEIGECGLVNNTAACDDLVFCNGAETCSAGTCSVHGGDPCDGPDGDGDCTESCDEDAQSCDGTDTNGSACDDSDECTTGDACTAGVCTGDAAPACVTTTLPPALCGDVNGDDEVTTFDALLTLRTSVGTSTCELSACDITGDGKVTSTDALFILRLAVGLPVVPHCPAA